MVHIRTVQYTTAFFVAVLVYHGLSASTISDDCLECICLATTNCNWTHGCLGDICGPYWLTEPYWMDANKPTVTYDSPATPGAFERCASDRICAVETVKNYMSRYAHDCNDDGEVTCYDYGKMHRLGAFGCSGTLDPAFQPKFDTCLEDIGEPITAIKRNRLKYEIYR